MMNEKLRVRNKLQVFILIINVKYLLKSVIFATNSKINYLYSTKRDIKRFMFVKSDTSRLV